jgi:hypothetical protein
MNPLNLILLAALAIWAWIATRSLSRVRRQLDEAESRLARRFYKLQGRVTQIDATVRQLEFDRLRRIGAIRFSAEMRLGEALAVHPRVGEVFAAFGVTGSGCSGGSLNGDATIAETCRDASLDVLSVLGALERFLEDPDAPIQAEPATAKLYQIQGSTRER